MWIVTLDAAKFGLRALAFVPETIRPSVSPGFPILVSGTVAFGAKQDDVLFSNFRPVIIDKCIAVFRMMTVQAKPRFLLYEQKCGN